MITATYTNILRLKILYKFNGHRTMWICPLDDYYFYVRFFVTRGVSKLVRTVLSSEFKNIDADTQKNTRTHNVNKVGEWRKKWCRPKSTNEGSKEPHWSEDNRTFFPEKWGWFWASVEVHNQNSESTGRRYMRGGFLKFE